MAFAAAAGLHATLRSSGPTVADPKGEPAPGMVCTTCGPIPRDGSAFDEPERTADGDDVQTILDHDSLQLDRAGDEQVNQAPTPPAE